MPIFSTESQMRLSSCHYDLQVLFREVIKYFDCSILWGYRGEEIQNKFYRLGQSQKKFPDSLHNQMPSLAVDVAPFPIDWKDENRFHYFAGFVMGIAATLNIPIRWGGDWNRDTEVKDNKFNDLGHFEIVRK
jgi:peptidoglycan LD-endopeptidase CwlK